MAIRGLPPHNPPNLKPPIRHLDRTGCPIEPQSSLLRPSRRASPSPPPLLPQAALRSSLLRRCARMALLVRLSTLSCSARLALRLSWGQSSAMCSTPGETFLSSIASWAAPLSWQLPLPSLCDARHHPTYTLQPSRKGGASHHAELLALRLAHICLSQRALVIRPRASWDCKSREKNKG